MSDGGGSEAEAIGEGGSDAERAEETASQAGDAAAEQAEPESAVPAIPDWACRSLEMRCLEFGDRVVVVIDMESGQRFIIRCEAAIPLPALVHVLS